MGHPRVRKTTSQSGQEACQRGLQCQGWLTTVPLVHKPRFYHTPVVWPHTNCRASLSLSFLACKVDSVMAGTVQSRGAKSLRCL